MRNVSIVKDTLSKLWKMCHIIRYQLDIDDGVVYDDD